jgi:hypothetical protein
MLAHLQFTQYYELYELQANYCNARQVMALNFSNY